MAAPTPHALAELERIAEEIDDAVVAHDWAKVDDLVRRGDHALTDVVAAPAPARATAQAALTDARDEARNRHALGVRQAANRLAGAVVDMYEPLAPRVPANVMRLDVLLREVDLAAIAGDAARATSALDRADAVWMSLSTGPSVVGSAAGRRFARQLNQIHDALGSRHLDAVERTSVAALEGVDALENLYERPARR